MLLRDDEKEEEGAYFNLMKQGFEGESIFDSQAKRYFGPEYTSEVFVSQDQTHVAIKLKPEHAKAGLLNSSSFDVFKGFNELKFFGVGRTDTKQGHFLRDHKEYVATLEVS